MIVFSDSQESKMNNVSEGCSTLEIVKMLWRNQRNMKCAVAIKKVLRKTKLTVDDYRRSVTLSGTRYLPVVSYSINPTCVKYL